MKALLIVDIQNDFLPGGALAVPQGDEIIPLVNALQSHFDLVVATQDWHPQKHGSFASAHETIEVFSVGELGGLPQVFWPDHCVQQSSGAEFAAGLDQSRIEAIFRKGTRAEIDSYSGFYDNGKLNSTGLEAFLKGKGISKVFVCGLAADYCVGYTAEDAVDAGFKTFFIEDATRYIAPQSYEQMKEHLQIKGVKFISSSNILE